jgi:hypothetical protein
MNLLAMILQSSPDANAIQQQFQNVMMVMIPIILIAVVVGLVILIVPFWFICKKAGMSPWLSLLNLIPVGNLVLLYMLAFSEWKVVPAPQLAVYPPPVPPPYPPAQPPYPPAPPAPPAA